MPMYRRDRLETGRLRQYVDIQTRVLSTSGEPASTWQAIPGGMRVPCEVQAVAGGEKRRGQQIEADVTTMITMRFREDVDPTMRLKYGTRLLNIMRVYDPDGLRVQLVAQCREVA